MKLCILVALLALTMSFDTTAHYVIGQMVSKDMQDNKSTYYKKVLDMLTPLVETTGAGNFPFLDAFAYASEIEEHGFSLGHEWHYQHNAFFDGVPEHDVEIYDKFNLLNEVTYSLFTVDATSNSRIDKTFGKSFMLRYLVNLIGEMHDPMHSVVRYSTAHKEGDDFGKLHKLSGNFKNLNELWGNAFGQYGHISYPIKTDKEVSEAATKIMEKYPRKSFENELKVDSKKAWNDASKDIAIEFAYTAKEGSTPSSDYMTEGSDKINRQMALAAYRIADQLVYCMDKQ